MFAEELAKVEGDDEDNGGEALKPSDVLARRFSDEPGSNGFALMERYERGMRSQVLRLMRQFDQLKKHRPTTPYDPSEPPCPSEGSKPAWTAQQAAAQRAWFAEQERLHAEGKPPDPHWVHLREIHQRQLDEAKGKSKPDWYELRQEHLRREAEEDAHVVATPASPLRGIPKEEATQGSQLQEGEDDSEKRSQSKPTEIVDSDQPAGKCAMSDASPVTKRSQRDGPVIGAVVDPSPPRVASRAAGSIM